VRYVPKYLTVICSCYGECNEGNTGEEPERKTEPEGEPNWEEELNQEEESDWGSEPGQEIGQQVRGLLTHGEQDSGTRDMSQKGSAELTGKLCQCVLALISWKVSADKAVMNHMVQALEEWLRRRGISIYTDLV
jgi:hypothetical protein